MVKRYITKLPDGRKKQYAILLGKRILLTNGKIVEDSLLTKTYRSYFIPENFVEEEPPANGGVNGGVVNGAINVKGEKGDKGDKGDRGERGLQGERGEKGEKGDPGERGLKGEKGDRGEQGIQGERGLQGERGERGLQGLQGIQGERGLQGERGERGEKGEKGDPGERGADAVLPNFKTINGVSLIGDGDISPVTEEVKEEIRRAVNADILPNLETMGQALQNMHDIDKNFKEKVVDVYGSNISELQDTVNIIVGKINKLFLVVPEEHLDQLLLWSPANSSQWSNVFGGTSVASNDTIRFNNQKSCFLAPENVTGIQFRLRGPNNPGQYILWLVASVNSSDESDIRSLTVDFQTYIEATYTNWIKSKQGHTSYDGLHGATAQNIKDVFNVHNVEITVVVEDGKIKCSNALGFRFEVPKFSGPNFITRLGIGSQANFSNNVEAYDIKFLYAPEQNSEQSSSEASSEQSSSENSNQTS